MKLSLILVTLALLFSTNLAATKDGAVRTGFVDLPFTVGDVKRTAALYVPPKYDKSKRWPLIVYLHGGGQGGDNNGNAVEPWGKRQIMAREIAQHPERFPALVLIPRCPKGKIWSPTPPNPVQSPWRLRRHGTKPVPDAEDHVTKAIGATISAYSVDEDRITLTGHSMGGEGSTRYAALHADRLAGVAPSAGSAVIVLEDAPALAKIGVWIFQGEHDRISTVALATRMVAAIRKAEGDVRYTEFKGVRHASAKPAYSDPKVIDWLLKQKRRTPSPKDKKPTRRLPDAEKAEKKAE